MSVEKIPTETAWVAMALKANGLFLGFLLAAQAAFAVAVCGNFAFARALITTAHVDSSGRFLKLLQES
jgi:hypothetical protein